MASRSARRADDRAVAGVVAGIIMLGALVAFLALFTAVWVPTYVSNKEASHATDVKSAMDAYADAVEDHIGRNVLSRSFSRTMPLGVEGIPVLGKGASGGDLAVEPPPTLTADLGATPNVASASGAVSLSTHTTQYPNQTYRYALGAIETSQSDGAFVDLRSVLGAQRSSGGHLALTLQVVDLTGAPQAVAGNGAASIGGTLNAVANHTLAADPYLRINITGLPGTAGAWRAAINRTLASDILTADPWSTTDCYAASAHNYCFPSATNSATRVDLLIRDIADGSTIVVGTVAAEIRG